MNRTQLTIHPCSTFHLNLDGGKNKKGVDERGRELGKNDYFSVTFINPDMPSDITEDKERQLRCFHSILT